MCTYIREMRWIHFNHIVKHLLLMLCAKFDGNFEVTVDIWLTFCEHGIEL